MKTQLWRRIGWFIILILASSGVKWAQESPSTAKASVDQEREEQEAKDKANKEAEKNKRKDQLGFFSEVRNNATLSFGISESYDSNILQSSDKRQGDSYTFLYPHFFANIEKKTVQLSFNYLGGYRVYNRFSDLNTFEHSGDLGFRYQPSTRTIVSFTEQFTYFPTQSLFQPGQSVGPSEGSILPPVTILINNQTVFRNALEGNWKYMLSGQTSIELLGGQVVTRWPDLSSQNSDGYDAGFKMNHRVNPRLALQTEYTFLYSQFNNQFVSSTTHRTGMGFTYDVRPSLSVYVVGGPEFTTNLGVSRVDAYVNGGIKRTARSTTFTAEYNRSVQNYAGLATPQSSQTVGISIGRLFAGRLSIDVTGLYFWSHTFSTATDKINGFQVGPRLIYKIRPSLAFVTGYSYVRQNAGTLIASPPDITRHLITCGFEYRLPPLLHR